MEPHRADTDLRHFRRGFYLLPSIFTVGNMFCGYACIMFSMRGELETAVPFIGIAVVLDMLDGRIARMTNTTSAFGLELDSLADIVSFGIAPAVLAFAWGLSDLGRFGWAAGFVYLTFAAWRLARFNIQTGGDKRYFVGMPSPSAAGVVASTVYAWPYPARGLPQTIAAAVIVLLPAVLMVSTVRFRSF
jgi:CDP-diacylglycerol--serine O-phosphatidyltransferase